jgi:hypothetical protein
MKTHARQTLWAALAGIAMFLAAQPASAVTAEDVMTKMSSEYGQGYLSGMIDMLAYQTGANGNVAKGNCIIDAFFDEKRSAASWAKLRAMYREHRDKRPEILLTVLANQICK